MDDQLGFRLCQPADAGFKLLDFFSQLAQRRMVRPELVSHGSALIAEGVQQPVPIVLAERLPAQRAIGACDPFQLGNAAFEVIHGASQVIVSGFQLNLALQATCKLTSVPGGLPLATVISFSMRGISASASSQELRISAAFWL
jgi:hypothetical protein